MVHVTDSNAYIWTTQGVKVEETRILDDMNIN